MGKCVCAGNFLGGGAPTIDADVADVIEHILAPGAALSPGRWIVASGLGAISWPPPLSSS